jgi:hypothetical protein
MNWKQRAVLAGLTMACVFVPACRQGKGIRGPGHGQHFGQQKQREFRVYIYTDPADSTKCYADTAVATLWKTQSQTVTWVSDDDQDYFVDFSKGKNGSPFAKPTFLVPHDGEIPSGDLTTSGLYYDYAIYPGKDASGKWCKPPSDPGFYVKP